jgi:hypothetical protein
MRGISNKRLQVFAPAIVLSLLICSLDRRGSVRILAIALLLGVGGATARAQQHDLGADAILSYRFFGTEGSSSNGFNQIYDVSYQRQLSDPLHIRLFFRGEGNNANQTFSLVESQSSFWQLQPFVEVDYTLPQIQFIGRYEAVGINSHFSDNVGRKQYVQRGWQTLNWLPLGLPSLTIHGEQFSNTDPTADIDQSQSLVSEAVNYTWRGLTLGQYAAYRTESLPNVGFSQSAVDLQGIGQLQNSYLDGRLSVSAQAVGGLTHLEQTSSSTSGASVPTQVTIVAVSYAHDETPMDSRDAPPVLTPALIDADFKTSAGISLGLDAPSFQNVVLDLGRFVNVDAIRIFVRDSGGNLVPFGGLVRWDVYTTTNGTDWTSIGIANTAFILSLSAYEVTFPKTPLRWVKVVNFGVNSVDTRVTEVQAFFHTAFAAEQTRNTDVHFVTANVNVSGLLTNWLTLSYNGIFDDYTTVQTDRPDFQSQDNDQIVSLEFKPSRVWDLQLRYENRSYNPRGATPDELNGYWGIFQFTPNLNLQTTVEASRVHQNGGLDLTSDTLRVTQYLKFLDALYMTVDGGETKSDSTRELLHTKTTFLDGAVYAQLRRSLRLTLAANLQKTDFSGAGAAITGIASQELRRYYAELYYQPSSKLIVSGRYGYSDVAGLKGTIKSWRLQWYPFAGGTVGIGTIYTEDINSSQLSQRFRQLQVMPTWVVNPHATITLNYNLLTLQNSAVNGIPASTTSQRQFFVSLMLVL